MMHLAPFAHGIKKRLWLADGIDGAFREDVQVFVCDDGGDFENPVGFGAEARHFQIDPDEIGFVLHNERRRLMSVFGKIVIVGLGIVVLVELLENNDCLKCAAEFFRPVGRGLGHGG